MSEINELAAALAQAQGKFKPVPKTGKNPHLRNEYATLDDIIGAIRGPLSEHGLSFVQLLSSNGDGVTNLKTILLHESGQQLESSVTVAADPDHRGINDLQALGAAITYMKRYSLAAMLGIAADADTDGEGTEPVKRPERKPVAQKAGESPVPTNGNSKPKSSTRPLDAETIRSVVRKKAQWFDSPDGPNTKRNAAFPAATEKQVKTVASLMSKALPNLDTDAQDHARHDVMNYLFGVTSTADLRSHEASALIDWLKADEGWEVGPYAQAEVAAILTATLKDAGQVEMALDVEPPAQEDAPF